MTNNYKVPSSRIGIILNYQKNSCHLMSDRSTIYLDHAGAALPAAKMMESISFDLLNTQFANPHSHSSLGNRTEEVIHNARASVFRFLNASPLQYDVVFTSGATAACKLVAEYFPWEDTGVFCYPINVHTSVLGMRTYCKNNICINSASSPWSSAPLVVPLPAVDVGADVGADVGSSKEILRKKEQAFNLLAVVGECNFTGVQTPLETVRDTISKLQGGQQPHVLVSTATATAGHSTATDPTNSCQHALSRNSMVELCRQQPWMWLLDASKLAATTPIDLEALPPSDRPHFVCLSLYKIFGYPTGLGVLLIRRDAANLLRKR